MKSWDWYLVSLVVDSKLNAKTYLYILFWVHDMIRRKLLIYECMKKRRLLGSRTFDFDYHWIVKFMFWVIEKNERDFVIMISFNLIKNPLLRRGKNGRTRPFLGKDDQHPTSATSWTQQAQQAECNKASEVITVFLHDCAWDPISFPFGKLKDFNSTICTAFQFIHTATVARGSILTEESYSEYEASMNELFFIWRQLSK